MAVRYTPDGRWLISSGEDGTVRRWPLDPDTSERSEILYRVDEAWGAPKNLALPPDGSFVAFATTKGRVAVLPFDGGPIRALPGFKGMITGLAVGPRGRFVAAGGGYTDKTESVARVWDLQSGEVHVLDEGNLERIFVDGLHFTPEGELLVTTDKLRRWVLGDGPPRLVSEKKIDNKGVARGFSPDSSQVLVTEGGYGPLFVVDLETGTARPLSSHARRTNRAIFDPTGTIVVSADADPGGAISVGPVNGEEPHLLFGHESSRPEGLIGIDALAVSPDGKLDSLGRPRRHHPALADARSLTTATTHTAHRRACRQARDPDQSASCRDPDSLAGWQLEIGPFPGWEEVPTW